MKIIESKLKKMNGYEEGKIDAIDSETSAKALSYKKNFLKQFIAISPQQIDTRLGDTKYYVTRKYDGEFATIVFEKNTAVTINRSGRVRRGIPCVEEAAKLLKKAGIKEAVIPAEIYVDDSSKRTRTLDLIHALSAKGDVSTLRLAVFDVLELDNETYRPESYEQAWQLLTDTFAKAKLVKAVEMEVARSTDEVKNLYRQWVDEGTAEGLVVRSDLPFVFKVKPRHYVDAVVIGFTEGTGDQKGEVRTFLVAMMPKDGVYQVVGNVGGGMANELKKEMFTKLSAMTIESDFIDTDSNFVAFRMVKPQVVMEFTVRDVIYETPNGSIENTQLKLVKGRYVVEKTVTGLSFIAPVFERFRDDKSANATDTRLSQIQDFASFEQEEVVDNPDVKLAKSKLLSRDIYKKMLGEKVMIQKYLIWKTNKEKTGLYPAYVLHYSNYSSQRQEPLQRDVRISSSLPQIKEIYARLVEENVKKGWEKIKSESLG